MAKSVGTGFPLGQNMAKFSLSESALCLIYGTCFPYAHIIAIVCFRQQFSLSRSSAPIATAKGKSRETATIMSAAMIRLLLLLLCSMSLSIGSAAIQAANKDEWGIAVVVAVSCVVVDWSSSNPGNKQTRKGHCCCRFCYRCVQHQANCRSQLDQPHFGQQTI